MEKVNLHQLRQQRKKQYWDSIAPYFRYVGGSLLGFILLIGFGLYGYDYFVHHLPNQFPVYVLIAALLTFPISSVNFRTYLREEDIVFLLPLESRMSAYINPCLRSAYLWNVLLITVIWIILWPLYQATHTYSLMTLIIIWLQFVLMKSIVVFGIWQENQMQEARSRQAFVWIRPIIVGLFNYVILTQAAAWSLIAIGLASIGYLLLLRATPKFKLHWNRLFVLEQSSRSRWMIWFSLFVEVPRVHSPIRQTRWMHRIAHMVNFKKSNAYRYLYLLTWIRSDLFRVVMRLTIIGVIVIVLMSNMYIKIGLLVLFAYITKLQLSQLEQYHKNIEVSSVYPVQQHQRAKSAQFIASRLHLIMLVVLILLSTFISLVQAFLS